MSSGRYQHLCSGDLAPARHTDRVPVLDPRARRQYLDACLLEVAAVGKLEARNLAILGRDEIGPGKRSPLDGPAEARGVAVLVPEAAGEHEELLRDAAPDDAGTSDAIL